MKSKIRSPLLFLISIMALFLVAGCGNQQDTSGSGSDNPFIGGTTGLVFDFEEDSPPAEVTDDGTFSFVSIVRLENKGETPVSQDDVKISLEGFLPTDFGVSSSDLQDQRPNEDLEPVRRDPDGNKIDGTVTFVTIPDEDKPLVPKRFNGNVEFPFRANVCYKYATQAQARICVLKDLLSRQDDPLCNPNTGGGIDSSSSPVQITGFRQSVIGKDKISFSFDVTHSGNGNIFKIGDGQTAAECPSDAREIRTNEDQVHIKIDAEGLSGLSCNLQGGENDGYVRLIGGKRTVTCTLDLTGQHDSDFEAVVGMSAEFNYEDFTETKVLVKHLIE